MSNKVFFVVTIFVVAFWISLVLYAPAWLFYGFLTSLSVAFLIGGYFVLRLLHAYVRKAYIIPRDEHGNLGRDLLTGQDYNMPTRGASPEELTIHLVNLLSNSIGTGSVSSEWAQVFLQLLRPQTLALPQGNRLPPEGNDPLVIEAIVRSVP